MAKSYPYPREVSPVAKWQQQASCTHLQDLMRLGAGGENCGITDTAIPDNISGPAAAFRETQGRFRRCREITRTSRHPPLSGERKARARVSGGGRRARGLDARPTSISRPTRRSSCTNAKWVDQGGIGRGRTGARERQECPLRGRSSWGGTTVLGNVVRLSGTLGSLDPGLDPVVK